MGVFDSALDDGSKAKIQAWINQQIASGVSPNDPELRKAQQMLNGTLPDESGAKFGDTAAKIGAGVGGFVAGGPAGAALAYGGMNALQDASKGGAGGPDYSQGPNGGASLGSFPRPSMRGSGPGDPGAGWSLVNDPQGGGPGYWLNMSTGETRPMQPGDSIQPSPYPAGPMTDLATSNPQLYKMLQMHMAALNAQAYRPEMAQARLNALGNQLSAYQPMNNVLGAMYGRQNQIDTTQAMKNPMSPAMMQIGAPNLSDMGLSRPAAASQPTGAGGGMAAQPYSTGGGLRTLSDPNDQPIDARDMIRRALLGR